MKQRNVAVTMGSPRHLSLDTASCRATEARFAANDVLVTHRHGHAIVAVMLDGSFDTTIGAHRIACVAGTAWTEPAEEAHENRVGALGARSLILEMRAGCTEHSADVVSLLSRVNVLRDPRFALEAERVVLELRRGDNLSALAVESIVLGVLVVAARRAAGTSDRRPGWLDSARALLLESFAEPPSIGEIARLCDVSPSHLCHAFKKHTGLSVGAFVRDARLRFATRELTSTEAPIAEIAARAGYADQAHLTRACRGALGYTPAAYRRLHSS